MCGATGTIIGMGGQLFSGIMGMGQGNAEAKAYESQATVARLNAQQQLARAEDASARGRQQVSDYREDANQLASAQRAAAKAEVGVRI